jgi:hypothetical protein
MKFSYWYYIATLLALLLATGSNAKVIITATNTSQHQRQEVVAWSAKDVWERLGVKEGSSLIVKNPYGQTVTHQITHDGRLLIDVTVRPEGTAEFTVEQGNSADFKPYVFGKQYAWRVDDITWENDIAAYRVYKELERMLKVSEIKMSVDKVLALAKTITTIQIKLPLNKEVYTQTMLMARHQKIAKLFDEDFWVTQ